MSQILYIHRIIKSVDTKNLEAAVSFVDSSKEFDYGTNTSLFRSLRRNYYRNDDSQQKHESNGLLTR